MKKAFFFPLTLSAQQALSLPFSFSRPNVSRGPFFASWPSLAQRPLPLPDSPPGGPRPSGSSPTPDRAGLEPESDPAARAAAPPLGLHAQAPGRPYKRNPRPPLNLAKPAAAFSPR